jgi:phosphoglycolate phosphatase-like HAD superfamily hydrolase
MAQKIGMRSIGVLWGAASECELRDHGALRIAKDFDELESLLKE